MAEDTIKDEEYAPITKGLRLYADTMLSEYSPILFHIKELCDDIDAIHRLLEAENERLRDASEHDDDWPLDADGVPILANDELFWAQDGTSAGRVTAIGVGERAGWVWLLQDGSNVSIGRQANKVCHRKPDTWASIINDAIVLGVEQEEGKVGLDSYSEQCEALVARCKALAGEGE